MATLGDEILNILREHLMIASSTTGSGEVKVSCACGHESEGELKTYTRETDDMNEVLADFRGHPVTVTLAHGTWRTGILEADPNEWSDGYKIGDHVIAKDDVVELRDDDLEYRDSYRIHARHQATLVHLSVVKRVDDLIAKAAQSGRELRRHA